MLQDTRNPIELQNGFIKSFEFIHNPKWYSIIAVQVKTYVLY
jgi:hypothetical protein